MRPNNGEDRVRIVQPWLLALLRFAVTLDNNERLAVYAIAAEIDGRDTRSTGFSFFRKTSVELCNAIANPHLLSSLARRRDQASSPPDQKGGVICGKDFRRGPGHHDG